MSRIVMVPSWSSRPCTSCFPGCATCSPTASTTVPICVTPLPNSVTGPSRSSSAPLTLPAFNCCPAVGWSNEPWLGSIETAAWQRISRLRSRAPEPGFTSPPCSSSSGERLYHNAICKPKLQPARLRFGHLCDAIRLRRDEGRRDDGNDRRYRRRVHHRSGRARLYHHVCLLGRR